ncbi:fez family zinc finger protein 1-like [Liolophura sinensis]|uniref:fez family zinc finger protein 1-like n=1 Tax=Liolophura sinensis TaxID=3198878 RepID=UPI0031589097
MGVTLERVQFKFASIIGELCSEPRVLSQFAVWLDLRLAEYKLRGSISLECSNEKPDPTWMNGIKDERPPETVLPYGVAGNKSKRKLRDLPYSNNAAQRHQSSRAMTYPSVSAENLTFQRPDHQIHSIDIPDHVSSSPVGRNQSFTDLPTDHTENRLSQSGPVKQEVVENSPVFPVAMISSNELRSTLTSKSAPSTNRRKRQPSAIVRNTSAQLLLGSNFASPGSSEDDPMPDSYFSSASPSKMCKVTEASAAQSTSETVTETDSSMCDLSKAEEFPVDSTTSSPMTAGQSEAVPQPPGGGDVPSTLSREDNSTFIPPVVEGQTLEQAEGSQAFECDICGKTFADQYNLTVHALCHTGAKTAVLFFCENCEVSLSKEEALLHIEVSHVVEERKVQSQPLPCPFCTNCS